MKRTIGRLAAGTGALLLLVFLVLLTRAFTVDSSQVAVPKTSLTPPSGAAERLAQAVRYQTVSHADPARMEMEPFSRFASFLVAAYPGVHREMKREVVEPCSLVYRWRGTEEEERPVLLAAHHDVVPVEQHEVEEWTHPPFAGVVDRGYVWGRGTMDDKIGVLGLLEAAELLISQGERPRRTVVFAFGCDEEVGGQLGAEKIAARFEERGESFEFALDEGLAIVQGYVPGIDRPVAMIGIVEKGFATYRLTVRTEGGHSSMPPPNTAIGILSRAVARLEEHQMPAELNPASRMFFETLAPQMSFGMKLVMANLWLLEPVLVAQLEATPQTNATVRTTTAVTVMHAGVQDNVLPKVAEARVNFRLAPGDSLDAVRRHVVDTIDDERISVELVEGGFGNPASRISSIESTGYATIRDAIGATFGDDVVVAPSATTGGTDVRHYQDVSDDQYRFAPMVLKKEFDDTARIHGIDERLSVEGFDRAIVFYADLISRL